MVAVISVNIYNHKIRSFDASAGESFQLTELYWLMASPAPDLAHARVSDREVAVLELMSQGCSAPEIGEALFISAATVRSHQRRIYEKLGVRNAAAAIFESVRHGILEACERTGERGPSSRVHQS